MYGIFTYIYRKNQLNVGKYTSPMDPMGYKGGKKKHNKQPHVRTMVINEPWILLEAGWPLFSDRHWSLRRLWVFDWGLSESRVTVDFSGLVQTHQESSGSLNICNYWCIIKSLCESNTAIYTIWVCDLHLQNQHQHSSTFIGCTHVTVQTAHPKLPTPSMSLRHLPWWDAVPEFSTSQRLETPWEGVPIHQLGFAMETGGWGNIKNHLFLGLILSVSAILAH